MGLAIIINAMADTKNKISNQLSRAGVTGNSSPIVRYSGPCAAYETEIQLMKSLLKKEKKIKGKAKTYKYTKKYKMNNPVKGFVHSKVRNAIRSGKLLRPTNCSICMSTKRIEGHHDDYSKIFDIIWVCTKCHKALHKQNIPPAVSASSAGLAVSGLSGCGRDLKRR